MLFLLWDDQPHRPTRDVNFLCFGDNSEAALQTIFRELCDIPVEDDGLILSGDSVQVETIRDEAEYGGIRVRLVGQLASARIAIQADIGFGDAVTPEAKSVDYPVLLDNPAPQLRAYPLETVVAEKYQTLVHLGLANSRMKDFYDLWVIACEFEFDGQVLSEAMGNTSSRRRTPLPTGTPSGLSTAFHEDAQKNHQWRAFLHKIAFTTTPPSLTEVCRLLQTFLLPPTQATIDKHAFRAKWNPGGSWCRTGRKGYSPACGNEWVRGVCEKPRIKYSDCPNQAFPPLDEEVALDRLQGRYRYKATGTRTAPG